MCYVMIENIQHSLEKKNFIFTAVYGCTNGYFGKEMCDINVI